MKRRYDLIIFLGLFFVLLTNCSSTPKKFEFGYIENLEYINRFFHFTMPIPEGWYYDDQWDFKFKESKGLPIGTKQRIVNGSRLHKKFDLGDIDGVNMLLLSRYSENESGKFNYNLVLSAENVTQGVTDEKRFIEKNIEEIRESMPSFEVDDEIGERTIGGKTFVTMKAKGKNATGQDLYQTIAVRNIHDFMLIAILSYNNDKEEKELWGVLDAITFDNAIRDRSY